MSRAKENATPCRIGTTKHEAVVERKTRARVRVSFPNTRVSRFSLASLEKREKITPVLQIVEERENLNGREKMPFSTFLRAIFFRPFRLSVALTICSWVSEDGKKWSSTEPQLITRVLCHTRFP